MFLLNKKRGCLDFDDAGIVTPNVCAAFGVDKIVYFLDREDESPRMQIWVNDHNLRKYSFDLPITDIYEITSVLRELASHGVIVYPFYREAAEAYLTYELQRCKNVEYVHSRLGWYEHNGELLYLHEKNTIAGGYVSKSDREHSFFTNGDRAKYEKFLRSVIYPHPTLALAMAIGYSSVVVSRLVKYLDFDQAIIVNFCGASSTGKTTASQLLVSAFGCPIISNRESLIRNFHSTTNALMASIDGVSGMPLVLDDITTNPNINTRELIYTLAGGEEKSRCSSDGTVRKSGAGWNGVIVISSETPIQDQHSENQGLKVRVLNVQDIPWTPDGKTAEQIKSFVKQNYGFTGKDFADYISTITTDDLVRRYEKAKDVVHTLMKLRDNLSDRLESKYSAIALTIELMNECFALTLDTRELMTLFLAPEQNGVADRDISLRALEHVKNYIITNRSNFYELSKYANNTTEVRRAVGKNRGLIKVSETSTDVFIPVETADAILQANNIAEIGTVRKRWREKKIIRCEPKRCTENDYLGRKCLHFVFPKGMLTDDMQEETQKAISKRLDEQQSAPAFNETFDDEEAIRNVFGEDGV